MAKHKAAQNCTILPWLSARSDSREGRFVQVGNSLLLSEEFHGLNAGARFIYLCMALDAGGQREFEFTVTDAKKYGIDSATLRRRIPELVENGFLEVDSGRTVRKPNRYRFSFRWKQEKQV